MWLEPGGLLDQHVEKTGAPDRDQALAELHAARPNGRLATTEEIAAAIRERVEALLPGVTR